MHLFNILITVLCRNILTVVHGFDGLLCEFIDIHTMPPFG